MQKIEKALLLVANLIQDKKIQISKIPNIGPGIAINDRIQRASKF